MDRYKPLNNQVYEIVREDILTGKYRPGTRIVIDQLSREFGVSKIPIREAINKLAAEELVRVIPNKGPVVTSYSPRDVQEIYTVRSLLEPYATRLAVKNINEKEEKHLAKLLSKMEEAYEQNDPQELARANYKFHKFLYKCSRNRWLYKVLMDLWGKTRRSDATFIKIPEHSSRLQDVHKELFVAIQNRDARKAEEIARVHVAIATEDAVKYAQSIENDQ